MRPVCTWQHKVRCSLECASQSAPQYGDAELGKGGDKGPPCGLIWRTCTSRHRLGGLLQKVPRYTSPNAAAGGRPIELHFWKGGGGTRTAISNHPHWLSQLNKWSVLLSIVGNAGYAICTAPYARKHRICNLLENKNCPLNAYLGNKEGQEGGSNWSTRAT